MSRRILHIIESLSYSGRVAQLLTLTRGLVGAGFDVHVAVLGGRGGLVDEARAAGVSLHELGRRWSRDPIAALQLHRLSKRLRPDAIHSWDDAAAMYSRFVSTSKRTSLRAIGTYEIDPWKAGWRWKLERRLLLDDAIWVANSSVIRDWAVGRGLPADKFHVIPPGVPPARASDVSRDELLRELQLPSDARLIGVVGPLVPQRRVKDLIWAADLLRVLHDNLRLLVIGDGPQRDSLTQYARMASDLDHIQFLGDRTDAWRIMPHLDVLWNASEGREHSTEIVDAMAAGVPVIASDTPFNRELVVEGETGHLVSLNARSGRAVRARYSNYVLQDSQYAARLGAAACRRAAECFSANDIVWRYVDLYGGPRS